MPFKSLAQRRKFYALKSEGKMDQKTIDEWESETKKKLPERLHKLAALNPKVDESLPYREKAEVSIRGPGETVVAQDVNGYLEFPGGGLNKGETPSAAAAREVLEETGITLKNLKPVGRSKFDFPESWNKNLGSWLKKWRGMDVHHFTAEPVSIEAPTSEEGDDWKKVEFKPVAGILSSLQGKSNDKETMQTRQEEAKAIKQLMEKKAASSLESVLTKYAPTIVGGVTSYVDAPSQKKLLGTVEPLVGGYTGGRIGEHSGEALGRMAKKLIKVNLAKPLGMMGEGFGSYLGAKLDLNKIKDKTLIAKKNLLL